MHRRNIMFIYLRFRWIYDFPQSIWVRSEWNRLFGPVSCFNHIYYNEILLPSAPFTSFYYGREKKLTAAFYDGTILWWEVFYMLCKKLREANFKDLNGTGQGMLQWYTLALSADPKMIHTHAHSLANPTEFCIWICLHICFKTHETHTHTHHITIELFFSQAVKF